MKRKSTQKAPAAAPPARKKKAGDNKHKVDIIGILMIVSAVLVFLALLSHSHSDETVADIGFSEFMRLFGGDPEIQARADTTSNWLGLFGAIIANFLINTTVGYFAIVFPVLLGIWGWHILRRRDLRVLAYYTNYSIIIVFLLSAFFGLLRMVDWMPDLSVSWSGNIGEFVSGIIASLIGRAGGIIVVLTSVVIIAVVVIDYDIHSTLDRGKRGLLWLRDRIAGGAQEVAARKAQRAAERDGIADADAAGPFGDRVAERGSEADDPAVPQPRTLRAEEALAAPRQTKISIARSDASEETVPPVAEGPTGGSEVADSEGGRRSDGTMSFDSIPGMGRFLKKVAPAALGGSAGAAKSGAATAGALAGDGPTGETAAAGNADERTGTGGKQAAADSGSPGRGEGPMAVPRVDRPAKEGGDAGAAEPPESAVFANEHEKKAVQQAVARKMMDAKEASVEDVNLENANTTLRYRLPGPDLLDPQERRTGVSDEELQSKADLVREKLSVFGIGIQDITVTPGPVVTLFELVPDSSVKISKIVSLSDDLALALAARGIRIIAPIPGKSAVGIEIPNNDPELVSFRSVVTAEVFRKSKHHLPFGMGKMITGEVYCDDLAKMPHVLIAGATGSGKSVGINVMISSLLYRMHPSQVKFVMIDPKKIELAQYADLSKHFLAVCPDIDEEIITDPANAVIVLKSLELEMDMRYTKLAKAGVRHVRDYNEKVKAGQIRQSEGLVHYQLPYIVVIIDELADLMITAAREVEEPIARLAQLARAVGIHLVLATQRPSVDVITGVIKANFPARVAYQVATRVDSRTVLDMPGAHQLLGNGDMLYLPGGQPKPVRVQNAYLSTEEVERIVEFIADQTGYQRPYRLPSVKATSKGRSREDSLDQDDLMEEAAFLIVRHQQGSVSLLQRRLKIGYSRAARIVDQLEDAGIVGPYDGSKARQVMVEDEEQLEMLLQNMAD